MQVHLQHFDRVLVGFGAIEQFEARSGIGGRRPTRVRRVKEGVHVNHVTGHLVCPFQDLGLQIN